MFVEKHLMCAAFRCVLLPWSVLKCALLFAGYPVLSMGWWLSSHCSHWWSMPFWGKFCAIFLYEHFLRKILCMNISYLLSFTCFPTVHCCSVLIAVCVCVCPNSSFSHRYFRYMSLCQFVRPTLPCTGDVSICNDVSFQIPKRWWNFFVADAMSLFDAVHLIYKISKVHILISLHSSRTLLR